MAKPCLLYVLGSERGYIKIGHTVRLARRMHVIRGNVKMDIWPIMGIWFPRTIEAAALEDACHKRFADRRLSRFGWSGWHEWYCLSDDDLIWLANQKQRMDRLHSHLTLPDHIWDYQKGPMPKRERRQEFYQGE